MTAIEKAGARLDSSFDAEDIKEARQMARQAIDDLNDRNMAGAVWFGCMLEHKIGTVRARKLLGKHADKILQQ